MKLLLARHGETKYNQQRKFYGAADVSLDEKGRQQAVTLAAKLVKEQPTLLVKTNLQRTTQTLAPLVTRLPQLPVVTIPAFAEKGFGNWEGLDADEIEAQFTAEWARWLQAPLTYTPPTVESFAAFKQRVHEGLQWLLSHTTEDDTVVVVAHLGTIRLIYQELVDPTINFYSLAFKASYFSIIELENNKAQQWRLNQ